MPRFENTRPDDDEDLKSEISSNEDKNILSSVRFSRLVDSRRISKDYYALLQKEQEKYAPNYLPSSCFIETFSTKRTKVSIFPFILSFYFLHVHNSPIYDEYQTQ